MVTGITCIGGSVHFAFYMRKGGMCYTHSYCDVVMLRIRIINPMEENIPSGGEQRRIESVFSSMFMTRECYM